MKRTSGLTSTLLCCSLATIAPPTSAEAISRWTTEGVVTVVGQSAQEDGIDDEMVASFDLVSGLRAGGGLWVLHLEGSTTPDESGVASLLPESNADAGTALDDEGDGRLQVSELFYAAEAAGGQLTAGLLDATAFLDQSGVANDETSQFLAVTLVNNPTIAFPDYAPGLVYQGGGGSTGPGYSLVLTSSHGLADNNASYSELLDLGDDGKGAFVAAELFWGSEPGVLRVGLWGNLADHERLDGTGGDEENFGLYTVFDTPAAGGLLNLRAGLANPDVAKASAFAALTYELPLGESALGAGLSHTWVSSEELAADAANLSQAEIYLRYGLTSDFTLSPSLQWIRNSDLSEANGENTVAAIRLNYTF